MQEIFNFLSNYFSVSTLIGLVASIIAGVIFIIYTQNKLTKIKEATEVIDSGLKAGVIKSLAEVIDLDEISKDLPVEEKVNIIKEILANKHKRFESQIGLAKFGISIIGLFVILLILSNIYSAKKENITLNDLNLNASFMINDSVSDKSLSKDDIENLIDNLKIYDDQSEKKLQINFIFPDSCLTKYGFKFNFSTSFYDLLGGNKISVQGWKSKAINNNSNRTYFVTRENGYDKNLTFTIIYTGNEK